MTLLIPILARQTGFPEKLIKQIVMSAPKRYKTYLIPKRSGESREISQPSKEVKLLQRALVMTVLDRLPIHSAAKAYRSGNSILDNARPHQGRGPILKMDFTDFFPSLRPNDWTKYCIKNKVFSEKEDIFLSASLLFFRPKRETALRLAIGAPSSPMLSNILMFDFDALVEKTIVSKHVIYTRYADDITFSAPRTGYLVDVISKMRSIIDNLESPKLTLNDNKTTYATRKFHRVVTGLTLANDGRVTISRENKRLVFARLHSAKTGKINKAEAARLCGYLAFIHSVEPDFMTVLIRKYGIDIIRALQNTRVAKADMVALQ